MDILKEINNRKDDAQIQALNENYGIISFKPDGIITYANDNFSSMFGYEKNEILNKHHKILCHKSFYESEDYINFWNNLKKGKSQSTVFRRIKKNGESIFLRASYKPLIDNNGNIFEILKFAQDVTEKKLEEINISSQLEAINKSTAIIEFDINGNILSANNNFLNISGYSLDEIQNKHHSMFCEESYVKSKDYKLFWDKLKNGVFDSGEYSRIGKNNKKFWIKASYNPIYNIDNDVIKIVKFAQDITEEKLTSILYTYSLENKNDELQKIIDNEVNTRLELETRLIQQSKMAEMGNMLDNILHQWKQPLAMLSLHLSEMKLDFLIDNVDKESCLKNLESSIKVIEFMNETSNNFRDFFSESKNSENFNLNTIILSVEKILAHRIKETNCKFHKQLNEDIMINGYKNEFAQVLLSILNNAFDKFVEENSENNLISIFLDKNEDFIVLKIMDNGGKIPESILPNKLFERNITTKDEGTGVGLSISKNIIENNFKGKLFAYNLDDNAVFEINI